MASYTEALGRFDAAVRGGDLQAADRAAREMAALGPVGLHSALDLVVLIGRAGDARFEGASRRWLGRLAQEPRSDEQPRTLTELQIAAVALQGIQDARVSRRCEAVLRLLVRSIDEEAGTVSEAPRPPHRRSSPRRHPGSPPLGPGG